MIIKRHPICKFKVWTHLTESDPCDFMSEEEAASRTHEASFNTVYLKHPKMLLVRVSDRSVTNAGH